MWAMAGYFDAGPCVIESEGHVRRMAEAILRITSELRVPYIFKASYDKANRTSVKSYRGPGLEEGAHPGRLAKDTGLAGADRCSRSGALRNRRRGGRRAADSGVPARQTDLLYGGKTGRAINIKKGQFVAARQTIQWRRYGRRATSGFS